MEKGIMYDQMPLMIEDLGSGFSNVNINITEVPSTDEDGNSKIRYSADVFRVSNPPTDENIVRQGKEFMLSMLKDYDKSEQVNSFTIQGVKMWLDNETRRKLKFRIEAERSIGKTDTILWHVNQRFVLPVNLAEEMLRDLEIYASKCYDKTEEHSRNVGGLNVIEDVLNYDITVGYPEKLSFN